MSFEGLDAAKDPALRASLGEEEENDGGSGPIVVRGTRDADEEEPGDIGGGYGSGGYGDSGQGGGGGGGALPTQQTEDAKDTPCVDEVPAGVNRDYVNTLIAMTGNVTADPKMLAYVTTISLSELTTRGPAETRAEIPSRSPSDPDPRARH